MNPLVELGLARVHHASHLLHLPCRDFVGGSRRDVEGMRQLGEVARFSIVPCQPFGQVLGLRELVVFGLVRDAENVAKLAVELLDFFGYG